MQEPRLWARSRRDPTMSSLPNRVLLVVGAMRWQARLNLLGALVVAGLLLNALDDHAVLSAARWVLCLAALAWLVLLKHLLR